MQDKVLKADKIYITSVKEEIGGNYEKDYF